MLLHGGNGGTRYHGAGDKKYAGACPARRDIVVTGDKNVQSNNQQQHH